VTTAAHDPHADVIASFRRRCAVAAAHWLLGKLDLHDAVDGLAAWAATHDGDIDLTQQIMADAFRPHRRPGDEGEAP
jgi:hypothetical protein